MQLINRHQETPSLKSEVTSYKIVYCDPPANNSIVYTTFVISTNAAYIVSADGPAAAEYANTLKSVYDAAKNASNLVSQPEPGDLVFACSEGEWARALVQKVIDNDSVKVAYFDYGNTEFKNFRELRHYTPESEKVKRYTFRVLLAGCRQEVDREAEAYLKDISENYIALRIRYKGEFNRETKVELYNAETDECLNAKVCELMNDPIPQFKSKAEKIWTFEDLFHPNIASEAPTKIQILNNESLAVGNVWICLEACKETLTNIQSKVARYVAALKHKVPFVPERGQLCLVAHEDGSFYRAAALDVAVDDNVVQVLEIDFGTVFDAEPSNVLKFPDSLLDPCFTNHCKIHKFPRNLKPQQLEELQKHFTTDSVIEAQKIVKGKDMIYIHLPNSINDLLAP